jgi:hypothetical protein
LIDVAIDGFVPGGSNPFDRDVRCGNGNQSEEISREDVRRPMIAGADAKPVDGCNPDGGDSEDRGSIRTAHRQAGTDQVCRGARAMPTRKRPPSRPIEELRAMAIDEPLQDLFSDQRDGGSRNETCRAAVTSERPRRQERRGQDGFRGSDSRQLVELSPRETWMDESVHSAGMVNDWKARHGIVRHR